MAIKVDINDLLSGLPIWAYTSGQKNNAYTMQRVQRSAVEAATSSSIGFLYSLNGSFAPQPGKAAIIRGFTVQSEKKVTLQIRVGTPTGVLATANIPEMDLAIIAGPTPVYIPCNWIIRNMKSVFINCLNFLEKTDPSDTDYSWVSVTPDVYQVTDDFNYSARKTLLWVGTSITNGSGPTSTGYMYHFLFKDYLRSLGKSVRNELNGISGSTTATHYTFFKQGAYDVCLNGKPPDVLLIELAVNDASAGISAETYTGRVREYAERALTNPDNKKTQVIVLGGTPLENTTAWNNLIALDTAAESLVNELNEDYPDKIFYIEQRTAFTRTDTSMYSGTDTPNFRIHLNDAGCAAVHNNIHRPWIETERGQTFLNNL